MYISKHQAKIKKFMQDAYTEGWTGLRKSETKPTTFLIQETRPWILLICCQPQNES